jgi:hypothetical protein
MDLVNYAGPGVVEANFVLKGIAFVGVGSIGEVAAFSDVFDTVNVAGGNLALVGGLGWRNGYGDY